MELLVVGDLVRAALANVSIEHLDGWHVTSAGTAAEAVGFARIIRFQVVICELSLVEGQNLVREIRKLYPVKAIAVSWLECLRVEVYLREGFEACIMAPLTAGQLMSLIRSIESRE